MVIFTATFTPIFHTAQYLESPYRTLPRHTSDTPVSVGCGINVVGPQNIPGFTRLFTASGIGRSLTGRVFSDTPVSVGCGKRGIGRSQGRVFSL